ncbi:OmpH family outer membrane protein [Oceanihabitans sediminis]|uniref:OmpH family outer membrane protein n=1 Tax=Oceanihabitans sediminis TaxID=1812012 RepID=A0A368P8V5_9FLAO|nr:OmpH family outer membrane protein [Oceanihabitans sediminis]MDX1278687.1 OmpH family outer membrane protein [Oceanihabitans sediminis]RBP34692.1 periplasmic chaperone for outer membrane proteins Skp [Oceanihabitans sediminis]RCU58345.1 OmpH family outer membrane protein [Oceanihabitans sediminis]
MKKIIYALLTVLVFTSCEQQKIAFIDNGELINNYQAKIDIEEKFKLKDEAFKKNTDSLANAFQVEAKAFEMAAGKMAQKKAEEKYQELIQKQQGLQRQIQMQQQVMQNEFQTEIDSVLVKVKDFVADYGKKHGYTYILGKNEAGSVLYGSEANDITEPVTEALNASYKK